MPTTTPREQRILDFMAATGMDRDQAEQAVPVVRGEDVLLEAAGPERASRPEPSPVLPQDVMDGVLGNEQEPDDYDYDDDDDEEVEVDEDARIVKDAASSPSSYKMGLQLNLLGHQLAQLEIDRIVASQSDPDEAAIRQQVLTDMDADMRHYDTYTLPGYVDDAFKLAGKVGDNPIYTAIRALTLNGKAPYEAPGGEPFTRTQGIEERKKRAQEYTRAWREGTTVDRLESARGIFWDPMEMPEGWEPPEGSASAEVLRDHIQAMFPDTLGEVALVAFPIPTRKSVMAIVAATDHPRWDEAMSEMATIFEGVPLYETTNISSATAEVHRRKGNNPHAPREPRPVEPGVAGSIKHWMTPAARLLFGSGLLTAADIAENNDLIMMSRPIADTIKWLEGGTNIDEFLMWATPTAEHQGEFGIPRDVKDEVRRRVKSGTRREDLVAARQLIDAAKTTKDLEGVFNTLPLQSIPSAAFASKLGRRQLLKATREMKGPRSATLKRFLEDSAKAEAIHSGDVLTEAAASPADNAVRLERQLNAAWGHFLSNAVPSDLPPELLAKVLTVESLQKGVLQAEADYYDTGGAAVDKIEGVLGTLSMDTKGETTFGWFMRIPLGGISAAVEEWPMGPATPAGMDFALQIAADHGVLEYDGVRDFENTNYWGRMRAALDQGESGWMLGYQDVAHAAGMPATHWLYKVATLAGTGIDTFFIGEDLVVGGASHVVRRVGAGLKGAHGVRAFGMSSAFMAGVSGAMPEIIQLARKAENWDKVDLRVTSTMRAPGSKPKLTKDGTPRKSIALHDPTDASNYITDLLVRDAARRGINPLSAMPKGYREGIANILRNVTGQDAEGVRAMLDEFSQRVDEAGTLHMDNWRKALDQTDAPTLEMRDSPEYKERVAAYDAMVQLGVIDNEMKALNLALDEVNARIRLRDGDIDILSDHFAQMKMRLDPRGGPTAPRTSGLADVDPEWIKKRDAWVAKQAERAGSAPAARTPYEGGPQARAVLMDDMVEVAFNRGLREAEVKLLEQVLTPEGLSADGRVVAGKIIEIALDQDEAAIWGAFNHEVMHALKEQGIITDKEYAVLRRHAKKWLDRDDLIADGGTSTRSRNEGVVSGDDLDNEGIADAYRAWEDGRLKVHGVVNVVFERIRRFFEALWNTLHGRGFLSAEDVFARISAGEMAGRPGKAGASRSTPDMLVIESMDATDPRAVADAMLDPNNEVMGPTSLLMARDDVKHSVRTQDYIWTRRWKFINEQISIEAEALGLTMRTKKGKAFRAKRQDEWKQHLQYDDLLVSLVTDFGRVDELMPKGAGVKSTQAFLAGGIMRNTDDLYMYTFDSSSNCIRRQVFTRSMIEVLKQSDPSKLPDKQLQAFLSWAGSEFRKEGKLATCSYCYVDTPRIRALQMIQGELLKQGMTLKDVDIDYFMDPDHRVRVRHPKKFPEFKTHERNTTRSELYADLDQKFSDAKSKGVEPYEEYAGQMYRLSANKVAALNKQAGFRMWSNSDFQIEHAIDLQQVITDMSIIGLRSHLYTKIAAAARFLGRTGVKVNMSVSFSLGKKKGSGPNGKPHFLDEHLRTGGMSLKEAQEIRKEFEGHGGNVGIVAVLGQDATILIALDDPSIDFIIPFHASGAMAADFARWGWANYSSIQHERWPSAMEHSAAVDGDGPIAYMMGVLREHGVKGDFNHKIGPLVQADYETYKAAVLKRDPEAKPAKVKARAIKRLVKKYGADAIKTTRTFEYSDFESGGGAKPPGVSAQHWASLSPDMQLKVSYFYIMARRGRIPPFVPTMESVGNKGTLENNPVLKRNPLLFLKHDGYMKLRKDYARTDTPFRQVAADFVFGAVTDDLSGFLERGGVGGKVMLDPEMIESIGRALNDAAPDEDWGARNQANMSEIANRSMEIVNPKSMKFLQGVIDPFEGMEAFSRRASPDARGEQQALFQAHPPEPLDAFAAWALGAKYLDKHGNIPRVYHGTTHNFESFDPDKGYPDAYHGPGIYLTTSAEDASSNYAGRGPDLSHRIAAKFDENMDDFGSADLSEIDHLVADYVEAHADRLPPETVQAAADLDTQGLQRALDEGHLDIEDVAQWLAEEELDGDASSVMPLRVALRNPLDLRRGEATHFDYHREYNDEGMLSGEYGSVLDLVDQLEIEAFGFDGGEQWFDYVKKLILEDAADYDGINARDVEKIARESAHDLYDDDGRTAAPGAILRHTYEALGYDGIVLDADETFGSGRRGTMAAPMKGITPGTHHIVAFDSGTVKSATGNRGTWDRGDSRVTYSRRLAQARDSAGRVTSPMDLPFPRGSGPDGGWNVVSLFDGLAAGRQAMKNLGMPVSRYLSAEVDAHAAKIAKTNHPDIEPIGDVTQLTGDALRAKVDGKVDLLVGGSPCQDLRKGREGLKGSKSSLFFEYARLKADARPRYFLFENTAQIHPDDAAIVSAELGVEPIEIDAGLVSGQTRKRYYWTNIPGVTRPSDLGLRAADMMLSADEAGKLGPRQVGKVTDRTLAYMNGTPKGNTKSRLQGGRGHVFTPGKKMKSPTLTRSMGRGAPYDIVLQGDTVRRLSRIDAERLQGLPDGYTDIDGVPRRQALFAIGNAYNVQTVEHILGHLAVRPGQEGTPRPAQRPGKRQGSLFSRRATATPEFKRWFGDSKVVDDQGTFDPDDARILYSKRAKDAAEADQTGRYLYHSTLFARVEGIAGDGLVPNAGGSTFGGYGFNAEGRVFLAEPDSARRWFGKVQDQGVYGASEDVRDHAGVMLRVRRDAVGDVQPDDIAASEGFNGSVYTTDSVDPEAIEFYHPTEERWAPISEWDEDLIDDVAPVRSEEDLVDEGYTREELEEMWDTNEYRADLRGDLPDEFDRGGFKPGPDEKLYSRRDSDTRNLLAQHNLTAENLLHAESMGGLVAPSLAVARMEHPPTSFGEITLIGPSKLVDPAHGVATFDTDVYSPRWPTKEYKVDQRKAHRWDAENIGPWREKSGMRGTGYSWEAAAVDPARQGYGRPFDEFTGSVPVMMKYAEEVLGETYTPKSKMHLRYPEVSQTAAMREFFADFDFESWRDLSGGHPKNVAASVAIEKAYVDALREQYADAPDVLDSILQRQEGRRISGNMMHSLVDDAGTIQTGRVEVDGLGTERDLEALIEGASGGKDAYREWAFDLLDPIRGEPVFTPGGRKRPVPYVAKHILTELTRNLRSGEGFNYGLGSQRAKGATQYRSIDAIKADRDRIVPKTVMQTAKGALDERLSSVAERLERYWQGSGFGLLDEVTEVIGESYKRGRSVRGELQHMFKNVPADVVDELQSLADDLRGSVTEYMEAKPKRVVGVDEFSAAVVPDTLKPEARSVLERAGVKITEYPDGDVDGRQAAIKAASEAADVLFSRRAEPRTLHGPLRGVTVDADTPGPFVVAKSVMALDDLMKTRHAERVISNPSQHESPVVRRVAEEAAKLREQAAEARRSAKDLGKEIGKARRDGDKERAMELQAEAGKLSAKAADLKRRAEREAQRVADHLYARGETRAGGLTSDPKRLLNDLRSYGVKDAELVESGIAALLEQADGPVDLVDVLAHAPIYDAMFDEVVLQSHTLATSDPAVVKSRRALDATMEASARQRDVSIAEATDIYETANADISERFGVGGPSLKDWVGTTAERYAAMSAYYTEMNAVHDALQNSRTAAWKVYDQSVRDAQLDYQNTFAAYDGMARDGAPKWEKYFPFVGTSRYTEIVLRSKAMPDGAYTHGHWGKVLDNGRAPIENPAIHIRMADGEGANGSRRLVVGEVQSDLFQEASGRARDYEDALRSKYDLDGKQPEWRKILKGKATPMEMEILAWQGMEPWTEMEKDRVPKRFTVQVDADGTSTLRGITGTELARWTGDDIDGAWDLRMLHTEVLKGLPFKEGGQRGSRPFNPMGSVWQKLATKRIVRWAAENGYDGIDWPTGRQSTEVYPGLDAIGDHMVWYDDELYVYSDGSEVMQLNANADELANYVGRPMAERLLEHEKTVRNDLIELEASKMDVVESAEQDGYAVVDSDGEVIELYDSEFDADNATWLRNVESAKDALLDIDIDGFAPSAWSERFLTEMAEDVVNSGNAYDAINDLTGDVADKVADAVENLRYEKISCIEHTTEGYVVVDEYGNKVVDEVFDSESDALDALREEAESLADDIDDYEGVALEVGETPLGNKGGMFVEYDQRLVDIVNKHYADFGGKHKWNLIDAGNPKHGVSVLVSDLPDDIRADIAGLVDDHEAIVLTQAETWERAQALANYLGHKPLVGTERFILAHSLDLSDGVRERALSGQEELYSRRAGGDDLGLVSAVGRGVSGAFGSAKQLDAAALMSRLRKQPNVKDAEIDWLGIEAWARDKGTVTRQEVAAFVEQGQARVTEFVYESSANAQAPFDDLTLPGGKNHRAILVQRHPDTPGQSHYDGPHWDDMDVLAHLRVNDRIGPDGRRLLHIDEVQSDWANEARKYGTHPDGKPHVVFNAKTGDNISFHESMAGARDATPDGPDYDYNHVKSMYPAVPVPEHPLLQDWEQLAGKVALRYAVEEGYDGVTWTTGKQQADRYSLAKDADRVEWTRNTGWDGRATQAYRTEFHRLTTNASPEAAELLDMWPLDWSAGRRVLEKMRSAGKRPPQVLDEIDALMKTARRVTADGEIRIHAYAGERLVFDVTVPEKKLSSTLNPKMAGVIKGSGEIDGSFSGDTYRLGGAWAEHLYDRMLPGFFKRYAKKWGAKPDTTEINLGEAAHRARAFEGMEMPEGGAEARRVLEEVAEEFSAKMLGPWADYDTLLQEAVGAVFTRLDSHKLPDWFTDEGVAAEIDRLAFGDKAESDAPLTVHHLPVTDAMRESVLDGQPLFSRRAMDHLGFGRNPETYAEYDDVFIPGHKHALQSVADRWSTASMGVADLEADMLTSAGRGPGAARKNAVSIRDGANAARDAMKNAQIEEPVMWDGDWDVERTRPLGRVAMREWLNAGAVRARGTDLTQAQASPAPRPVPAHMVEDLDETGDVPAYSRRSMVKAYDDVYSRRGPGRPLSGTFYGAADTGPGAGAASPTRWLLEFFKTADFRTLLHEQGHLMHELADPHARAVLAAHFDSLSPSQVQDIKDRAASGANRYQIAKDLDLVARTQTDAGVRYEPDVLVVVNALRAEDGARAMTRAGMDQAAESFRIYVENEVMPADDLGVVMAQLRHEIRDVWAVIRGQQEQIKVPNAVRSYWDRTLRPDRVVAGDLGIGRYPYNQGTPDFPVVMVPAGPGELALQQTVRADGMRREAARIPLRNEELLQDMDLRPGDIVAMDDLVARAVTHYITERSREWMIGVDMRVLTPRTVVPAARVGIVLEKSANGIMRALGAMPADLIKTARVGDSSIRLNSGQQAGLRVYARELATHPIAGIYGRLLVPEKFTNPNSDLSTVTFAELRRLQEVSIDASAGVASRRSRKAEGVSSSAASALVKGIASLPRKMAGEGLSNSGSRLGKALNYLSETFIVKRPMEGYTDPRIQEMLERGARRIGLAQTWVRNQIIAHIASKPLRERIGITGQSRAIEESLKGVAQQLSPPICRPNKSVDVVDTLHDIRRTYTGGIGDAPRVQDLIHPDSIAKLQGALDSWRHGLDDSERAALQVLQSYSGRNAAVFSPEIRADIEDAMGHILRGVDDRLRIVEERANEIALILAGSKDSNVVITMPWYDKVDLYKAFYEGRWTEGDGPQLDLPDRPKTLMDYAARRGLDTGEVETTKIDPNKPAAIRGGPRDKGRLPTQVDQNTIFAEIVTRLRAHEIMGEVFDEMAEYGMFGDTPHPSLALRDRFLDNVAHYLNAIVTWDEATLRKAVVTDGVRGTQALDRAPPPPHQDTRGMDQTKRAGPPGLGVGAHDMEAYRYAHDLLDRWGFKHGKGKWVQVVVDGRPVMVPEMLQEHFVEAMDDAAQIGTAFGSARSDISHTTLQDGWTGRFDNILSRVFDYLPKTLTHIKMGLITGILVPHVDTFVGNFLNGYLQRYMRLGLPHMLRGDGITLTQTRLVGAISAGLFGEGRHLGPRASAAAGVLITPDGRIYSANELIDMAREHGLDSSLIKAESADSLIDDIAKRHRSIVARLPVPLEWWQQQITNAYTSLDNWHRAHVFVDEIRQGSAPAEAADKARVSMFDYGRLTDREKKIGRQVSMLYAFERSNQTLLWWTILNKPSRVMGQLRLMRDLQEEFLGEGRRIEIPQGMEGRFMAAYRGLYGEDGENARGIEVQLDPTMHKGIALLSKPMAGSDGIGMWLDLYDAGVSGGGDADAMSRIMQRAPPWWQWPVVARTRMDMFSGRDIDQWQDVPMWYIAADRALTGGTIVDDVLKVYPQYEPDPAKRQNSDIPYVWRTDQGLAWWTLQNLGALVPGHGRTISTLDAWDRAYDDGPVEAIVRGADNARQLVGYDPAAFNHPAIPDRLAGPQAGMTQYEERWGLLGWRPVKVRSRRGVYRTDLRRKVSETNSRVVKERRALGEKP